MKSRTLTTLAVAIAAGGVLGLIVGSFLNVVILRLPPMLEYGWRREAQDILDDPSIDIGEAPPGLVVERSCCPKCGVQFQLRRKDSVEFKKKKAEQDELRQIKLGNQWASYAIAAAVLVVLLLLGLVVMSQMNK